MIQLRASIRLISRYSSKIRRSSSFFILPNKLRHPLYRAFSSNQFNDDEKKVMEEAKNYLRQQEDFITIPANYQEWVSSIEPRLRGDTPVVLQMFAQWSSPCQKFQPLLEEKIRLLRGQVKLIRVDIDEFPQISTELQIRSVPTLLIVCKGNIADMITGVPTELELEQFLQTGILLQEVKTNPLVIEAMIKEAEERIKDGTFDAAVNILQQAYSYQHWRERFATKILPRLAYVKSKLGSNLEAENYLSEISAYKTKIQKVDQDFVDRTNKELGTSMTQQIPPELQLKMESLMNKIVENQKEVTARYELAQIYFDRKDFAEAIEVLLDILIIQRNHKDAHKLLMKIFTVLGASNELAIKGRRKLSAILL